MLLCCSCYCCCCYCCCWSHKPTFKVGSKSEQEQLRYWWHWVCVVVCGGWGCGWSKVIFLSNQLLSWVEVELGLWQYVFFDIFTPHPSTHETSSFHSQHLILHNNHNISSFTVIVLLPRRRHKEYKGWVVGNVIGRMRCKFGLLSLHRSKYWFYATFK